jgi:uncharacterized membrane protein YdjX (TVP38/TMEM64 family)
MSIKQYSAGLFLILIIAAIIAGPDLLTIENIKTHKLSVSGFIDQHYLFSVFLFFFACVVLVNSPVPFAALVKVLSGFFFGFYLGAFYNIAATILACLAGFALSRYAFKDTFEKLYYQRLQAIETEVERNGFYYFLSLRLLMVVPYFLINITAGISRISFRHYLYSTVLGVMPASLIYANGGNQLERINSLSELFKPEIIASLLLAALISSAPAVWKRIAS